VSVELPGELAWVLNLLGFNWPNIDEDTLRAAAAADRALAARTATARGHADVAAEIITTRNSGDRTWRRPRHGSDQGKLPPDIQRPGGPGEGDFYSPSQNRYFDIKEANDTPPRDFNAARTEQALQYQLLIGRTPIIDTSGASESAIHQMEEILERNGWENRVIWYP
jgi:hypothetical protein